MSDERKPTTMCQVVDGQLRPCCALARSEDTSQRTRKGIELAHTLPLDGRKGRSFAMIRSGEFVHKGIVLNYCPFCGLDIAEHLREEADSDGESDQVRRH